MIETILTDIEGTTSSIAFVKDVLFPYAAREIPAFVRAHRAEPAVAEILAQTARESDIDATDTEALIERLLDWIRADRKITPLKTLQGLVWRSGYETGAYRAHIYADAAAALRDWKDRGLDLYVYSSGSIAAQRLFFRHSEAGDLTDIFSGYFDTTTGPKQHADSYRAIAAQINPHPERILFLSDVIAELDAARAAGLQTTLLHRPDDSPSPVPADCTHPCVRSFAEMVFTD
jgi:enolase-phosphatase E1